MVELSEVRTLSIIIAGIDFITMSVVVLLYLLGLHSIVCCILGQGCSQLLQIFQVFQQLSVVNGGDVLLVVRSAHLHTDYSISLARLDRQSCSCYQDASEIVAVDKTPGNMTFVNILSN